METKQVIVVRKDLKWVGWGKLMAQVAHASMAAAITNNLDDKDKIKWSFYPTTGIRNWLNNAFTKICVWADDEEHLLKIYNQAKDAGIPCSLIQDNGRTVFKGVPTYTTVGVGPDEISKIDKITGGLRLI